MTQIRNARRMQRTERAAGKGHTRPGPVQEPDEDEIGIELPVSPDEGTPLIPDDERVVNIPS